MSTEAVKQVLYSEEIQIPKGISVKLENKTLKVKGPKGECEKDFSKMKVNIEVNADKIIVSSVKRGKIITLLQDQYVKHIRI